MAFRYRQMLRSGASIAPTTENAGEHKRDRVPDLQRDESLSSDEDLTPQNDALSSPSNENGRQRRKLFDERWSVSLQRCISPRKSTTATTTGSRTLSPIKESAKNESRENETIQANQLISWDMEEPQSAKTCESSKVRGSLFMRRAIKPVPFLDDESSGSEDKTELAEEEFFNALQSQMEDTEARHNRRSLRGEAHDRRQFGLLSGRGNSQPREPLTVCVDHKPVGIRRRTKQSVPTFVDGTDSSVDQGSATSSELTEPSLEKKPKSLSSNSRSAAASVGSTCWMLGNQAVQCVAQNRVVTKVWITLLDIILFVLSVILHILSTAVTMALWCTEKSMLWLFNQPVFRYVVVVLVRLTTRKKVDDATVLAIPEDDSSLEDDSARCLIHPPKRKTLWQKIKAKRARKECD